VIASAVERLGIPGIETKDIFAVMQRFLDRLPKIEDQLGVRDVLVSNVRISMQDYLNRSAPLPDDFERLLTLAALLLQSQNLEKGSIYTTGITRCPGECDFAATIEDVEGGAARAMKLPLDVAVDFLLFSCSKNARRELRPELVWSLGAAYGVAIELAVETLSSQSGNASARPWYVGRKFVDSVLSLNLISPEAGKRILRECAGTVLGLQVGSTHPIRVGRGGNEEQLRQGDAAAWRRDIDYDYHLHYWSSPAGIEFASVVIHGDYSIPQPGTAH
ncbi:MAG: hypothetical protein ACRD40_17530, partial [Candidatus Acidiferrales bacterium]